MLALTCRRRCGIAPMLYQAHGSTSTGRAAWSLGQLSTWDPVEPDPVCRSLRASRYRLLFPIELPVRNILRRHSWDPLGSLPGSHSGVAPNPKCPVLLQVHPKRSQMDAPRGVISV